MSPSKSFVSLTAIMAAAAHALPQAEPVPTSLVTDLWLGPLGGEGVILASIVTADPTATVYALDCDEDEPCDIPPFTVTGGSTTMVVHTTYIGNQVTADYSCDYTGLAQQDTATCFITSTFSISGTGSVSTTTISTEYPDPSLYLSPITITAGLELLVSNTPTGIITDPTPAPTELPGSNEEPSSTKTITGDADAEETQSPSNGAEGDDSATGDDNDDDRADGSETTDPESKETFIPTNSADRVQRGGMALGLAALAAGALMI